MKKEEGTNIVSEKEKNTRRYREIHSENSHRVQVNSLGAVRVTCTNLAQPSGYGRLLRNAMCYVMPFITRCHLLRNIQPRHLDI